MKRKLADPHIFISDCEGPISKNDNAFEITRALLPRGDHLFSLLSKYDDVLADVLKRSRYRAGNTLKLITPFLKAYGATNEGMIEFSTKNLLLLQGAKKMLHYVQSILPTFIVSTSYEQYVSSLCALIAFPFEHVYCTRLDLDRYHLPREEVNRLRELTTEITSFPMIDIPENAQAITDFTEKDQAIIQRLDEIFWEELPTMKCGQLLEDVTPIGGVEKANAVKEIIAKSNGDLANVMYVGDSITDVQALQLVKKYGGLAISFNGNRYAVQHSEIAILSDNALITALLVAIFSKGDKQTVVNLVREWGLKTLEQLSVNNWLVQAITAKLPFVEVVENHNVAELIQKSSVFRRNVRGEAIGRLG